MLYYAKKNDELYHHGIKGQKWGVRRYQNEDGSLTAEGIKRYGVNKNGWVSKEGRKLMEADLREERDATGRAYRPDIYRYNVVKGWNVEDRFKDYKDIQKLINPELLKKKGEKVVIYANKYGKMDLSTADNKDLINKGFKVVKSMDDIMELVDLNDKKTK